MVCDKIVEVKCPKGHVQKRKCYEIQPPTCRKCDMEEKREDKILERDMELQDQRLKSQTKHDINIADLDMQIRKIREEAEDKKTALERTRALEQKKRDLEAAKFQAAQISLEVSPKVPLVINSQPARPPPSTKPSAKDNSVKPPQLQKTPIQVPSLIPIPTPVEMSPSEEEWERQKRVEGASNDAIDDLMGLTGLEEVKQKFLDIKAKIETVVRQGIDMKKERMGMVMLGNPGTGMYTTVLSPLLIGYRENNSGTNICTIPSLCRSLVRKGVCRDYRLRASKRRRPWIKEDNRGARESWRWCVLH